MSRNSREGKLETDQWIQLREEIKKAESVEDMKEILLKVVDAFPRYNKYEE